jgi:hypothetical protein
VATAGLVIAAAATLGAQTPEEHARVERLARRYAELAARASRKAEAGAPPVDSVRVGGLVLFTDSLASPVFEAAVWWLRQRLAAQLGDAALPLLAGGRIGVRFANAHPGWARLVSDETQLIAVQQRRRTAAWLRDQFSGAVDAILARRGGASFAAWRADVRLFQDPAPVREATYLELLTASAPGARGCYDGSLAACAHALHLHPGQPLPSGEAAAELRRYIAQRLGERAAAPALASSYAACVERKDDAACLEFLEQAGVQPPTLSTRAAGTLLVTVSDLGGPEALARFFADTGAAVVPRLEAAAGMPLDSLLARWRGTILACRPAPTAVPAAMQWLVLGWTGVLVALAARSTRWR